MGCDCKKFELIIGLVVIIFALWGTSIVSAAATTWILVIAGALLIIHGQKCKNCGGACDTPMEKMPMKKTAKKKRKK